MPGHYLREGNEESQTLREILYKWKDMWEPHRCQGINVISDQNDYHHFY